MKRMRVIPVLLLAQHGMVKTKNFTKPRYLGDPINAVKIFNEKQADELVLLDIEATSKGRIEFDWIEEIVSEAFMPIAYGGGISTVEQCAELLNRGVEKIIINTSAIERQSLISEVAARFGAQAVVVSIDAKRNFWRKWRAYTGSARKESRYEPAALAMACEKLGAGEIFLTSVERESSYQGYDLDLLRTVSDAVSIPVIAHGGAGKIADFTAAAHQGHASAVAAGSMFVFAAEGEGMLISYPGEDELTTGFWNSLNT